MKFVLFLIACTLLAMEIHASNRTATMLVYRGERAADGTLLLTPMVAPQLGVEIVAGPEPHKGQALNCQASSRPVGKVQTASGPAMANQMILNCGSTTFSVKGIVLRK